MMTIMVYFHASGYKTFKDYYCKYVRWHMQNEFHNLPSYNRFVELQKDLSLPLALLVKLNGSDKCTGKSIIDSTTLDVCHIKKSRNNKVFKNNATKSKSSMGWFFGFKLHLVINEKGEILNFELTTGSISDSNREIIGKTTKNIFGKLIGDKGYLGLFSFLYDRGIQLITKIKKSMKNKLMNVYDKFFLTKRGVIESVIGVLKTDLFLDHSQHRSQANFLTHICSTLVAYMFRSKKPSIQDFCHVQI